MRFHEMCSIIVRGAWEYTSEKLRKCVRFVHYMPISRLCRDEKVVFFLFKL